MKKKILYLGNQLSQHGFTPTTVEVLGKKLNDDFILIQGSSAQNKLFRLIHMWFLIIRHRNFDYLLIDTYSTSAFIYAWTSAMIAKYFNLKYIPILHGGDFPKRAKNSFQLVKRFLINAHTIVCPSYYLKEEMEKIFDMDYLVIPNFIELQNYPFTIKIKKSGIKILWVRSFHEIYNPLLAIKVLKQLHDLGYKSSVLCMVGPDKDGSMEKTKQLVKELNLKNYVNFTGKLSKAEWIKLSNEYNIFLNTTNVDNMPVSVMEALALGFPVISTKVGGIPYLFKDQEEGIMVEPDNPDAISAAIADLMKDAERVKYFSLAARKKATEWDWQVVKKQWIELLN